MPKPSSWPLAWTTALLVALGAWAEPARQSGDEGTGPTGEGDFSQLAPLAANSLLLDVATAGDRIVAVGERGHVLFSEDEGWHWRQVVVPTRTVLTAVYFASPQLGWAVGHDAVVLHTRDAGASWQLQHRDPALESPLLDVWFDDEQRGFAVGAYGLLLRTSDGGASWQRDAIGEQDVHHNAIAESPDGSLYVVGEMGSLFRSADRGSSWQPLDSPYSASFFGAVVLPDGALVVFGLRGHVYRSEDRGESFQEVATGTEASLMGGTVTADGEVLIGGIAGVVLQSSERGRHFHLTQRPTRRAVAAATVSSSGVVLVGAFGAAPFDPADPTGAGGRR